MLMDRFSAFVRKSLEDAGWYPGRRDDLRVQGWIRGLRRFEPFPAARDVLAEFGGLRFGERGQGFDRARSTVEMDPMRAMNEEDRFRDFEKRLGEKLFPLGEVDDGHAFLAITDRGRVYKLMDEIWFVGATFEEALVTLIEGRSPKMP